MTTTLIPVKVDPENGCEKCWAALREELEARGIGEPIDDEFGLAEDIFEKFCECPHDPPAYAPGIIVLNEEIKYAESEKV